VRQKRESCNIVRIPEHHVIGADHQMQVQFSADNLNGERVRTRHVFFLNSVGEPVVARVPHQNYAVAARRIFLQKFDQTADLVAAKMFAPAVPVRRFDAIIFFRKIVPDFCERLQKSQIFISHQKPSLFRDKNFQRNFSQREQRKSFFQIEPHRLSRKRFADVSGAEIFFFKTVRENLRQQILVLNVKFIFHRAHFPLKSGR